MSTENAPTARPPRLNPFSFPSDTDFRFVLLIATVVGVSMVYYQLIILGIPFISRGWQDTQDACMNRVFGQQIEDFGSALDLTLVNRYLDCTRPVQAEKAAWVGGGVLLLLATATILYWIFPIWKMRYDHLAPLSAEDAPEVITYLAELCQEVALSRPPTFLWNPLSTANSGVAFGRRGRYYVALSGGLISQFYTDRPAFRAMLLHELAHLKNTDVDKAYFALAV
jgi:Zn-dependent protease with chaperone function